MRRGLEKRDSRFKVKQKGLVSNLRNNSTLAERILWQRLRNRRLDGLKFRQQHAIGQYIVDFFCSEHKLIIEIDGSVHEHSAEADRERQDELESLGYHVLRFKNSEVCQGIQEVLYKISSFCSKCWKSRTKDSQRNLS